MYVCAAIGLLSMVTAVPAANLPADHAGANVKVLVSDTWLFKVDVDNKSSWEPYADVFGDGTFAVIGDTYPQGLASGQNYKVAFVNVDGTVKEYWAFYDDSGKPYTDSFNEVRQDGNPGRVACDRRTGGTTYVVGGESTPYDYPTFFDTDKRWEQKFVYDDRIATVEAFSKTANGPQPLTKVIDPVYGSGTIEGAQGAQQMRFGGDIRFLSNGNILVVVEDRTKNIVTAGDGAIATIFDGKTAAVLKGPFNAAGDDANHDIWSNVAAFKDGFAVRSEGITTIYDNAGNRKFTVAQADWTTVKDAGRGDGVRLGSSINSKYIYLIGVGLDGNMILTRMDATTGTADKEIVVNEDALLTDPNPFDRANVAVDDNDTVCVSYEYRPDSTQADAKQIVSRVFDKNMAAVTPTFYAYVTHDASSGYISHESSVAMDTKRILIVSNGKFEDAAAKALTPAEQDFAVVFENPVKTSVSGWELF